MKKLMAVILGTMVLLGSSAFAADSTDMHKCKAGHHWDTKKMACVKDATKK